MIHIVKYIAEDFSKLDEISTEYLKYMVDEAKKQYYSGKKVLMEDDMYDMIVAKIYELTGEDVDVGFCDKKSRIKLPYWLGSMNKIKNDTNDLLNWTKKFDPPYYITDKLDGVSALLIYDNDDNKVKLYTRGNGTFGFDISHLIKYLDLPSLDYINRHHKGKLVLRGELIMKETVFNDNWSDEFKNSRHMMAGIVNSKNFKKQLVKDIDLIIYEMIIPEFITQGEQMEMLNPLGFKTINLIKFDENLTHNNLTSILKDRKDSSDYQIDGIIVTTGQTYTRNTDKNPSYAIAYKSSSIDKIVSSEVIGIEWNVSKNKLLKPTVIINPINIHGVTVKKVTGNNARYIVNKGIGIGTKVDVILSGSIIPKIVEVYEPYFRDESFFPDDVQWEWDENRVDIIQTNENNEFNIKYLTNFFNVLDAPLLRLKTIALLYQEGYTKLEDFLTIDAEEIKDIHGLGIKKATQIQDAISNIRNGTSIDKLMLASGVLPKGFGKAKIEQLLSAFPNIVKDFDSYDKDELITCMNSIPGWGDKTSIPLIEHFPAFLEFYSLYANNLINIIDSPQEPEVIIEFNEYGLIFVFSGFRNPDLKKSLEEKGHIVIDKLTKNVQYLVVKDISKETNKTKYANDNDIEIINLDYLLKNIDNI